MLKAELRKCGASELKSASGGVSCEVSQESLYRICLWSRIANRVLMPIDSIKASTPDELYDGARVLGWAEHFPVNSRIAVDCTLTRNAAKWLC